MTFNTQHASRYAASAAADQAADNVADYNPVAVLVAVDGTAAGDYLVYFEGLPLRGGETPLLAWQVDDLIERGYSFV